MRSSPRAGAAALTAWVPCHGGWNSHSHRANRHHGTARASRIWLHLGARESNNKSHCSRYRYAGLRRHKYRPAVARMKRPMCTPIMATAPNTINVATSTSSAAFGRRFTSVSRKTKHAAGTHVRSAHHDERDASTNPSRAPATMKDPALMMTITGVTFSRSPENGQAGPWTGNVGANHAHMPRPNA